MSNKEPPIPYDLCMSQIPKLFRRLKVVMACSDENCDDVDHARHHEFFSNPEEVANRESAIQGFGTSFYEEKLFEDIIIRLNQEFVQIIEDLSQQQSGQSRQKRIKIPALQDEFKNQELLIPVYLRTVCMKEILIWMMCDYTNCAYEYAEQRCQTTEISCNLERERRQDDPNQSETKCNLQSEGEEDDPMQSETKITDLPDETLETIFKDIVLEEGDSAYGNLSLVCKQFYDICTDEHFRRECHLEWLRSLRPRSYWRKKANKKYYRKFTIQPCFECGHLFKDKSSGFFGRGIRGESDGFYTKDPHRGYCSKICRNIGEPNWHGEESDSTD